MMSSPGAAATTSGFKRVPGSQYGSSSTVAPAEPPVAEAPLAPPLAEAPPVAEAPLVPPVVAEPLAPPRPASSLPFESDDDSPQPSTNRLALASNDPATNLATDP